MGIDCSWAVFLLCYISYCVLYITRKNFSIVKMLIQKDLNLSFFFLGSVDMVFLSVYALCQVFLPSLSDVYGVRNFILWSFFGAGVFSLLFSVVSRPELLLVLWFCEGVTHASVFPLLVKTIIIAFGQKTGFRKDTNENVKILAWWTTSQQVGGILATAILTYFTKEKCQGCWRTSFQASGVITLVMALVLYLFFPDVPLELDEDPKGQWVQLCKSPRSGDVELTKVSLPSMALHANGQDIEDNETNTIDGGGTDASFNKKHCEDSSARDYFLEKKELHDMQMNGPKKLQFIRTGDNLLKGGAVRYSFLDVLALPGVLSCGVAYFCVKFVRYALVFWLPFFFVTQLEVSPANGGYASMVFEVGGVFGSSFTGWLVKRAFRGRRLKATSALCTTSGCLLFLLACLNIQYKKMLALKTLNTYGTETHTMPSGAHKVFHNAVHNGCRELLFLMLAILFLAGSTLSGPESILGTSASLYLCDVGGIPSAFGTMTGIINGIGALGGVIQSYALVAIVESLGWTAMFACLSVTCFLGIIGLITQNLV